MATDKDISVVIKESDKQILKLALQTERERLKRSLAKEISGSQISLLRAGEISRIDQLIVQLF